MKLVQTLKQNAKFDIISKRWAVASRMRTFYQEMKKSISEALEKRRQKLMPGEHQEVPQLITDEPTQIDTSTNVLTGMPSSKSFSTEDNEKLERDIQTIVHRIIEKSEFLLKLATPEIWEEQSQDNKEDDVILMRTTSDIADQKHKLMQQNEGQPDQIENPSEEDPSKQQNIPKSNKEWKKKLGQWRMMQQSKGVIKSMENMSQNKIFDSLTGSVLACLQSAISLKRLKKSVE